MRSVMVFGAFDPLHEGHRSLFRQALRHGDELLVVVARDESIRTLKHHEPRNPEEERQAAVQAESLVDRALLGDTNDFLKAILDEKPDVLILGYDQQTYDDDVLRKELKKQGLTPEIKRAVAFKPETYKSSKL
jgi:FAD synthetase